MKVPERKLMFTKKFWVESSERALKTFAQTLLAMIGAVAVFDAFTADWLTMISVSLGATVLSYLTSIVSAEVGDYGTPSLVARIPDLTDAPVNEPEGGK